MNTPPDSDEESSKRPHPFEFSLMPISLDKFVNIPAMREKYQKQRECDENRNPAKVTKKDVATAVRKGERTSPKAIVQTSLTSYMNLEPTRMQSTSKDPKKKKEAKKHKLRLSHHLYTPKSRLISNQRKEPSEVSSNDDLDKDRSPLMPKAENLEAPAKAGKMAIPMSNDDAIQKMIDRFLSVRPGQVNEMVAKGADCTITMPTSATKKPKRSSKPSCTYSRQEIELMRIQSADCPSVPPAKSEEQPKLVPEPKRSRLSLKRPLADKLADSATDSEIERHLRSSTFKWNKLKPEIEVINIEDDDVIISPPEKKLKFNVNHTLKRTEIGQKVINIDDNDKIINSTKKKLKSNVKKNEKRPETIVLDSPKVSSFPITTHVRQECDSSFWHLENNAWKLPDLLPEPKLSDLPPIQSSDLSSLLPDLHKPIIATKLNEERLLFRAIQSEFKWILIARPGRDLCRIINHVCSVNHINTSKYKPPTKANDNFTLWTEKYKPRSLVELHGNENSILVLYDWLTTWLDISKESPAEKANRTRIPDNVMILRGSPGTGKTSAVYAICEQLKISVLELNASSRRTGRGLLHEIQEATKSHQLQNEDAMPKNVLVDFLGKAQSRVEKPENKMCVLFIEDVDVVFKQDEGFNSALTQLVATSKRPIIMTLTNMLLPQTSKLTKMYRIIPFSALSGNTLAGYFQAVCLAEGIHIDKQSLIQLIEWNKGDTRKVMHQLQLWVQTGGDASNASQFIKANKCMRSIGPTKSSILHSHKNSIYSFLHFPKEDVIPRGASMGEVWWNMPNLINIEPMNHAVKKSEVIDAANGDVIHDDKMELAQLSRLYDRISFCDTLMHRRVPSRCEEPTLKLWQEAPIDGTELTPRMDEVPWDRELIEDNVHYMLNGELNLMRSEGGRAIRKDSSWMFAVPPAEERKWRHKQHSCASMFQDAMSKHMLCNRSAFYLDYAPALRAIARSEAIRSKTQTKRTYRFRHYFDTLGIETTHSNLNTACDTLRPQT